MPGTSSTTGLPKAAARSSMPAPSSAPHWPERPLLRLRRHAAEVAAPAATVATIPAAIGKRVSVSMSAEHDRLRESREQKVPWKKWGPYLSERQWGTVREDYSANGDAWNYFSHDQARSRAYHWGEDGLAGFSDDKQQL